VGRVESPCEPGGLRTVREEEYEEGGTSFVENTGHKVWRKEVGERLGGKTSRIIMG